jgi:hypothetical protein
MARMRIRGALGQGIAGVCITFLLQSPVRAQAPKGATVATIEEPDAQRVKEEMSRLLEHYPPSLRSVLALDPGLLGNQSYLAPYQALVGFLNAHPEIARAPSFYIDAPRSHQDSSSQVVEMWKDILNDLAALAGFALGIGLLVWLIRTLVDYRRWNRLAKVQTDFHTKILDRFSAHDDLLAYIQSPAGSRFLQSTPIMLDAAPRSIGAPLARILWSVQGGIVLMAGGFGLEAVSGRVGRDAAQPFHALGVLGIALGLGFVASAIISFVISHRLGLFETARTGTPGASGSQE